MSPEARAYLIVLLTILNALLYVAAVEGWFRHPVGLIFAVTLTMACAHVETWRDRR